MNITPLLLCLATSAALAASGPVRLRVGFSKPDGAWSMPALALGQGGLQSDPMIAPHIKELPRGGTGAERDGQPTPRPAAWPCR